MTDIFVDGIRSIAVANGVTRIELLQLRRAESGAKLEPAVVATLLVPVSGLKDLTTQLANTLQKLSEASKAKAGQTGKPGQGEGGVEAALENL